MLPGELVTYGAFGAFVGWLAWSLARDVARNRRATRTRRCEEPVLQRVARQACADTVWPDAPPRSRTVGIAGERHSERQAALAARQIGDLEDLLSRPSYRGVGH